MIEAVIIEDEALARTTIKSYLSKYFPDIVVTKEITTVFEAKRFLERKLPDIVFVDVQLRDGKSHGLFDQLDTSKTHIVYTTAYEEYAMKAFRQKAYGYLLKPIDPDDFKEIIDRILNNLGSEAVEKPIRVIIANGNAWIKPSQIVRCESKSNYTKLICSSGKRYTLSKTLKVVENELLKGYSFIRVHQSHLINYKYVASTEITENKIQLLNGDEIPVSRANKATLIEKLSEVIL